MVYNFSMSPAFKTARFILLLTGGILHLLAALFNLSADYILKLKRDLHL